MRNLFLLIALFLSAEAPSLAQEIPSQSAPSPEATGLTIQITDLVPGRGELRMALFETSEAFDQRSPTLRSATVIADGETFAWQLEELPPGDYAVTVYQDLNVNQKLDKGKLGIPKEPYGFSNNARSAFGPPGFDQARFNYGGGVEVVEIKLLGRGAKKKARKVDATVDDSG